jgi:nitrile hydratase
MEEEAQASPLPHDVGGNHSVYGPIPDLDKPTKELLAWEQQCHCLFAVLASKKVIGTDELRRSIEALTPQQYASWTYYEKWSAGMASLLLEHKVITHSELQTALFGASPTISAEVEDAISSPENNETTLYKPGDSVRVGKFDKNGMEWKRPHIRTPGYVYGVAGTIERVCGRHADPSLLAFGLPSPAPVQLYRVRFRTQDIWPEQQQQQHAGKKKNDGDVVVEVEVYEHWLEPADTSMGHDFEGKDLFNHASGEGSDCQDHSHAHHHHHGHHHGHEDDEDDPHTHEARPLVEERAIQREGVPRPGKELFQALFGLLKDKDVVTSSEIRIMCEKMDTAEKQLDGATLVVNAWLDASFEERLLADASSAAQELGISTANANAPTVLTVVKNTPMTHNLIVCTLCSCYPSSLLGIAPSWYKSREYRARAVREPRRVLEEFGLTLETAKGIRVHDSTADHRYIVLPERPADTFGWSKEKLKSIITRDTMVGVAISTVDDSV